MKPSDLMLALFVVVIWGVNFSFIKIGLEELPPILFSALRFAIVALPAAFFIPFPKTSVWNVIGVGLFLGVFKFGLLFIAMKQDASAGISSLLLQAQVFFTIALSMVVLKESVTKFQLAGISIALVGFVTIALNVGGNITALGLSMLLLAALFWGFANLIMKRMKQVNLLHFMVWVSLIPPIPLLLLSYYTETNSPIELLLATSMPTWGALAFVSYLSTLVAFAVWGKLLSLYSAAVVTPFALLIPIAGIATSSLMLGEVLTSDEIASALLIMFGLSICVFGSKLQTAIAKRKSRSVEVEAE